MRKAAKRLAEANEQLNGALEDTPTWLNEKNKAAAGSGFGPLLTRVTAYIFGLRPVRAMQRYGVARGALLAGGLAYSAMFAVAGALAIGLTIFSVTLGSNQALFDKLVDQINTALPGIVQTDTNPDGLLDPNVLILDNPFNPLTIISAFVLLWSAITLMSNLRISIQAMFGIAKLPRNFVIDKLLDLSAFVILGVGALLSTGVTALVQLFAPQIFELLQLPESWGALALRMASLGISLIVDMLVFIFLFRIMSGARAPELDLFYGALFGALASAVVRFLGTAAVGSVADNPLLAPFAAIATLLLWVNLIARITLIAAAFAANPPEQLALKPAYFEHAHEKPNYVTKSRLHTLTWDFDPISGVVVPQTEPKSEVVIPKWHGLKAVLAKKKIQWAQRQAQHAQAKLEEAQAAYDAGALQAYHAHTRPTTDSRASISSVNGKSTAATARVEPF